MAESKEKITAYSDEARETDTRPPDKTSSDGGESVARSALVVMIAMIVSRVLGYLRDVIIYARIREEVTLQSKKISMEKFRELK